MSSLLEVRNLSKTFVNRYGLFRKQYFDAVKPVSFTLEPGQTLALIGQNSSGKSTLAKMIAGVIKPSSGEIFVNGDKLEHRDYSTRCKLIRVIFQDPNSSLNPRIQIGQILEGPLKRNTAMTAEARRKRVVSTLRRVGLLPEHAYFYPQMLAAGQKQRVCIARALILQPSIIIADEALNGLDMAMRSQIINLLLELQDEMGLSFIYVSQQIGIVKHISDKVMVMANGEVVEAGDTQQVLSQPQHIITQKLVDNHFFKAPNYSK
ncbi:peptide ABC transporter ATP-binding protein [Vibrio sp. UCD-FRSSP16_10]|uniref:peptide ABC transporter ATP-binding protein n=1 Tax=unclassified Vibrio TaxID=2614977 RepID=UPI0008016D1D|nr:MULTISPECIES: ATP-binding cassette domain-containing protein [unclassified Vibrio]OBT13897.1 peptide ABC transporter ATP-binding protein [Vibrio sp. UCD-FRSSP16_30]OBT22778.1 peptide ABC transporter ATP-binding protein [Vibrio sp. UCD-FRSSP16_10]